MSALSTTRRSFPPPTLSAAPPAPALDLAAIEVRRFDLADIDAMGTWLSGRLTNKHPDLTDRVFPAWVRSWIIGNEYCFVRTDDVIGLAQIYREPLDADASVREIFVYSRIEEPELQGVAIYRAFRRWANQQGAKRMIVASDSDVPMPSIRQAFENTIRNRNIQVVSLESP